MQSSARHDNNTALTWREIVAANAQTMHARARAHTHTHTQMRQITEDQSGRLHAIGVNNLNRFKRSGSAGKWEDRHNFYKALGRAGVPVRTRLMGIELGGDRGGLIVLWGRFQP